MDTLLNLLSTLMPLLYGVAAVNYMVFLIRNDRFAGRTCTATLIVAVSVACIHVVLRAIHFDRYPIVGQGEALTLIALAMGLVYLYVERLQKNSYTGAFILPMVALLQVAGSISLTHDGGQSSAIFKQTAFGLHAVFAILGYSAFAVSFVYGLMYTLLFRSLRRKNFGVLFERLPSLDELANMGFWAGFFGWLSLTITILLGVYLSRQIEPHIYKDPKFLVTLAVWAIYGVSAHVHFNMGWRGSRAIRLSMAGFVLAVIAMLGSGYLWSTFHSFGAS